MATCMRAVMAHLGVRVMCVHLALRRFQNTQFPSDKSIRRLQGLLCSSPAIDISLEYERS